MIRYWPLSWCPIARIWLGLDLYTWQFVDLRLDGGVR